MLILTEIYLIVNDVQKKFINNLGKKLRYTVKVSKPKTNVTSISPKTSDGKPFISDVNRIKTTFKLSSTSKNVVAQIVDESGNICYTKEFKRYAKNASVSFSWNGKDTSGQNLPSARYRARITVGKTVRNGKYFTLYSGNANAEIETITNDNEEIDISSAENLRFYT